MKRATILLLVLAACGGSEDEQTTDADNPCPQGSMLVSIDAGYPLEELKCRTDDGVTHGSYSLRNAETGCVRAQGSFYYGDKCGEWTWRDERCDHVKDQSFPPCPY